MPDNCAALGVAGEAEAGSLDRQAFPSTTANIPDNPCSSQCDLCITPVYNFGDRCITWLQTLRAMFIERARTHK